MKANDKKIILLKIHFQRKKDRNEKGATIH